MNTNIQIKVEVKGRSGWGEGPVSGGVFYNPDPCAWVEIMGEVVRIQYSSLYRVSREAGEAHQKLVRRLQKIRPLKKKILFSDDWTGATLAAEFGEGEISIPLAVFEAGVLAQIRASCCGIAHGTASCRAVIASRHGAALADAALQMYPEDFCGYGQVFSLSDERKAEIAAMPAAARIFSKFEK